MATSGWLFFYTQKEVSLDGANAKTEDICR